MKPEIIRKKLLLAGLETQIDFTVDFSRMLEELRDTLRRNLSRIPHAVTPVRMIGFWQPNGVYFTGIEVTEASRGDFVLKDLPESLFAIFREERRGVVGGLGGYAYNQWLPGSGYWVNEALPGDFEIFEVMEHCGVDDACDICIPIVPQTQR